MPQRLFNVSKVPVQLDAVSFGMEKRRGEDVKVAVLTCRVQPFDGKYASALDAGVGADSNIKATVFNLNNGEPKSNFTRHDFALGLARQDLEMFASSDTSESRVALTQVKILGTYVRTQKDMPTALALVFRGVFGPVGRDELEFLNHWFRSQYSVTFSESEHSLAFEQLDADTPDEEAEAAEGDDDQPALPAHEFETESDGRPVEAAPDRERAVNRKPLRHTSRKKSAPKGKRGRR